MKRSNAQTPKTRAANRLETVVHGIFLLLGLVTVGCVLLMTVYLILSGLPAIPLVLHFSISSASSSLSIG